MFLTVKNVHANMNQLGLLHTFHVYLFLDHLHFVKKKYLTLEIRKGKKKEGRINKKLSGPSVQHRTLKKKRGSCVSKRDPLYTFA
jgi:hypothetical protein